MHTYVNSKEDFEWRFTFEQKDEEAAKKANDTALTEQTTAYIFYYPYIHRDPFVFLVVAWCLGHQEPWSTEYDVRCLFTLIL